MPHAQLDASQPDQSLEVAVEFVRAWVLPDGTRCAIAGGEHAVELRLVRGDTIIRRAQYTDVTQALRAARSWRLDCEREQGMGR